MSIPPRPQIHVPGGIPHFGTGHQLMFQAAAGPSGYTKHHSAYHETKQKLAKQAYATHAGHVVSVQVRAVRMPIGGVKAVVIGVCFVFCLSKYIQQY